jgi:caspase domain-containing protein
MPALDDPHALVVGISTYKDPSITPLDGPCEDARAVHAALKEGGYPDMNLQLLLDGDATRAALLRCLDDLAGRSTATSITIYLSCHGGYVPQGEHEGSYLFPYDTDWTSSEKAADTVIFAKDLTARLGAIPAPILTVIFDCCHAGGIADVTIQPGVPDSLYHAIVGDRGRVVLASSRPDEVSNKLQGEPYSLFTKHLLNGLRSMRPDDGVIRVTQLWQYVQREVAAEARANVEFVDQHPVFKAYLEEDYEFARQPSVETQAR